MNVIITMIIGKYLWIIFWEEFAFIQFLPSVPFWSSLKIENLRFLSDIFREGRWRNQKWTSGRIGLRFQQFTFCTVYELVLRLCLWKPFSILKGKGNLDINYNLDVQFEQVFTVKFYLSDNLVTTAVKIQHRQKFIYRNQISVCWM